VNGVARETSVADHESLLTTLRERLGLPGSKNACEQGECGSCSVLMDGELVCSCLVLAAAAQGRAIETVESLSPDSPGGTPSAEGAPLGRVQRAFVDAGAVQCGFCTPGLVVATHALLLRNPEPTEGEVREALAGNICRCTGYGKILEAVQRAAGSRSAPLGGAPLGSPGGTPH
jgi:carbon-monoxide dehydrogenase small subunit